MEKLREGKGVPHARAAAAEPSRAEACIPSFAIVELLSVHPRPEPLRAQRSGEQASGTRRLASRHLLGCCGQSGFWGASSATARRRVHLLPLRRIGIEIGFVFFLVDVRDCDYFVFFFLVDVRGTALRTSSCTD